MHMNYVHYYQTIVGLTERILGLKMDNCIDLLQEAYRRGPYIEPGVFRRGLKPVKRLIRLAYAFKRFQAELDAIYREDDEDVGNQRQRAYVSDGISQTQATLEVIARMSLCLNLDSFLMAIERADAVGPILDPTLYREAAGKLHMGPKDKPCWRCKREVIINGHLQDLPRMRGSALV